MTEGEERTSWGAADAWNRFASSWIGSWSTAWCNREVPTDNNDTTEILEPLIATPQKRKLQNLEREKLLEKIPLETEEDVCSECGGRATEEGSFVIPQDEGADDPAPRHERTKQDEEDVQKEDLVVEEAIGPMDGRTHDESNVSKEPPFPDVLVAKQHRSKHISQHRAAGHHHDKRGTSHGAKDREKKKTMEQGHKLEDKRVDKDREKHSSDKHGPRSSDKQQSVQPDIRRKDRKNEPRLQKCQCDKCQRLRRHRRRAEPPSYYP